MVSKILARLRKKNRLTQGQVAARLCAMGCRVTYKAVSKWETGGTTPDAWQFLLLCKLYGVDDVLAAFGLRDGGAALDRLNSEGRERVEEYISLLSESDRYSAGERKEAPPQRKLIPLYELPVSAGKGIFLDSDDYELVEVDDAVPGEATFAVRVAGDSMTPRFVDRQIIYVKQQQTLDEGEIGVFMLNGEAYLKKLEGNALVSLNKKYRPIDISEFDEFRVYGKVVG